MRSFADRVAVITGAASGIGAALARELARRGARVIAADLDEQAAGKTAAAIRATGGAAAHVRADVTSADDIAALAATAFAREQRVDLWINNAGIAIGGAAEDLALADWGRVLDVNLAGTIHGVHAIYPRMLRQGGGHIVNVASVAGLAPYPFALPYTTSKHAVVGLSLALRAEARARNIRVSVACPGMIRTPIWERSAVRGALANGRDRILSRVSGAMTAERCASAICDGIAANRAVIRVTPEAHVADWLARLSPALASWVSHRLGLLALRAGPASRAGRDSSRSATSATA
jgi:NAD(P)-dependent dehydrogenase (short-subunit alcohol dehydrogenase family)